MDKPETRILIVEDDRLALAALVVGLEASGYTIAKAGTGEEALAVCEAFAPHLIVMDICLPGISGIEVTRQIRTKQDVPVIFLSAVEDAQVVQETIAFSSTIHLVKPITLTQLIPAIESMLARNKEIRTLRVSEENLSGALKQSREISVAVGMLMERHNCSAEDAFELLRSHARRTRCKTGDVAKDVMTGTLKLASPPPSRPKKP